MDDLTNELKFTNSVGTGEQVPLLSPFSLPLLLLPLPPRLMMFKTDRGGNVRNDHQGVHEPQASLRGEREGRRGGLRGVGGQRRGWQVESRSSTSSAAI